MSLALLTLHLLRPIYSLPLNSPLLPSYDYIVVGGGPAGLTVANRLSEDPSVTVLVLEAGPADKGEPEIEIPGLIGDDIGGSYDWNLSTVPQIYLDGRPRSIPQGRVLSGGTVLNGMLWNRGGQGDYSDWVDLGNPGWSWDDLLPYFIKSETYTPVYSEEIAEQYSIQEYPGVHGSSGPVSVGFPKFFWNSSAVLFDALNEIGVPTAYDPNTGWVAGASFLPLDIDPVTQERCTARKAYYDPYADRPNLWVSTEQVVTQILFEGRVANANASTPSNEAFSTGQGGTPGIPGGIFGGTTTVNVSSVIDPSVPPTKRGFLLRAWAMIKRCLVKRQLVSPGLAQNPGLVAVGVEYAADSFSARQNVTANREVIVAAGALHSPQLLMLSGIGPASELQPLQIPLNVDLPGVGSNLQDHGRVWCWYPFNNASFSNPTELTNNETFASEALTQYWTNRTGPLTAAAIDGVAFPALPYVVNGSTAIPDAAAAQSVEQYLPANLDPTVINGYAMQQSMITNALRDVARAAYEIVNANDGVLTVAGMRPLSRGSVTLLTSNTFDPPIIDPRYGSNPVDVQVLQAAVAFNQRLLYTDSLSQMQPVQIYPPADATGPEIVQYINSKWQTEYHPAGTCAMMPIELGGVVSPDLLVYGTQNLRVVDSSIMPMLPAAHLQAVVYAIAEKAADIIKAANIDVDLSNGASSSMSLSSAVSNGLSSSSASPVLPVFSSSESIVGSTPPDAPVTALSSTFAEPATLTTFVTVVFTQTVDAA